MLKLRYPIMVTIALVQMLCRPPPCQTKTNTRNHRRMFDVSMKSVTILGGSGNSIVPNTIRNVAVGCSICVSSISRSMLEISIFDWMILTANGMAEQLRQMLRQKKNDGINKC